MRMLGNVGDGIDGKRFYIRNTGTLHAYQRAWWCWGFCKKIPVELSVVVCLERKDMDRSFCGTGGLFIAIGKGEDFLSFKDLLYTCNPIQYYALQTEENEIYYFNDSELNEILRVCTFNECLGSLQKASGY